MVKALTGGYVVTYHPNATDPENLGEPLTVDFTPPFRRVRMVPDLEKVLNVKLPSPSELGTEGNNVYNYHQQFTFNIPYLPAYRPHPRIGRTPNL